MGRFMNMWYALSARDPNLYFESNVEMPLLTEADCLRKTVTNLKAQKDSLIRKNEIKNMQIAALETQLLDIKAELEVEK